MKTRILQKALRILLFVTAIGFLAGCGGDGTLPTAPVTGKITFDGKPLANAEIWMVPITEAVKNAKMTIRPYAKTGSDGTFTVTSYYVEDGAPLGEYSIMVVPAGSRSNTEEERGNDMPAERKSSRRSVSLPAKYRDPTTSGVTVTVKDGANEFNIDLKSK